MKSSQSKRRAASSSTLSTSPPKRTKTVHAESDVKSSDDSGCPSSSFTDSYSSPSRKPKTQKIQKRTAGRQKPAGKVSNDVSTMDVAQLLALGEKQLEPEEEETMCADSGASSNSDSEVDDWEEVTEVKELKEPVIPKEGVSITLEAPNIHMKRPKKGFDMSEHVRRQLNRVKREMQVLVHKVDILCWIAHMRFVNNILNSQTLMGVALSLVSSNNIYPPKHADVGYLERTVKWFNKIIQLKENPGQDNTKESIATQLMQQFEHKSSYSRKHFVFMFIVMMRTLGLKTRLVLSFQTVSLKPIQMDLKNDGKNKSDKTGSDKKEKRINEIKDKSVSEIVLKVKSENRKGEKMKKSDVHLKNDTEAKPIKSEAVKVTTKKQTKAIDSKSTYFENSKTKSKLIKTKLNPKLKIVPTNSRSMRSQKAVSIQESDDESESKHFKSNNVKNENPSSTRPKRKTIQSEVKDGKKENIKKTSRISVKSNVKEEKPKTPKVKKELSDSDSEFTPESLKRKTKKAIDRRVLSSDDEEEGEGVKVKKKKQGMDVWTEVFLEAEEKWISVDVIRQKIHCVNELHTRATQPVVYVLACNNDSTLKDVTKRYVPNWHSDTRKRRVDEEWWSETMWPYLPPKTAVDAEEDEDIARQLEDKPLPTVIGEYKDHPLYALKRHLLKFEGIYPPEAPSLGFVRGEAVYARECVVTLRSREIWFKEARVVRAQETPYKIVKARPKFDKMTGEFRKDLPLEVFGVWQTEDYIPPTAENGKVPRNEYGNVDLFKPCMLPGKCVYLQIPGLVRVAKKLNIDCAPAVVGFDFHSGGSHPILDGFVVCEEFKEVLLDAWNKDIDETAKRNEEKKDKRVYGNWRRLIKGLLIREKLKVRYAFGEDSEEEPTTSTNTKTSGVAKPKPKAKRTKKE